MLNRVIWAVKDAVWFRQTEWSRLYIHNWIFTLANSVTSGFCALSSFLVSSHSFFGHAIVCDAGPVGDQT